MFNRKLTLQTVLAVLITTLATAAIVSATTIGNNISTDGTLTVNGTTYLNGNVGISTTSPSQKLSITGKLYTTGGIQFPDGSLQTAAASAASLSSAGQVAFYNTDGSTVSGTSTITILPSGYVGIGTSSPNWKLSVAGQGSFDDLVRASYFIATSTTATSTFGGAVTINGTLSGNIYATTTDYEYYNIAVWGDSLAQTMANVLSSVEPTYFINNGGYGGQNSTAIADRMINSDLTTRSYPAIIWAGSNDSTASMPTTLENNLASMVAKIPPGVPYLILGPNINSAYPLGDASHTIIVNTNNALAALYPYNFIDIRAYTINYACNPNPIWYASTTQDVIDCGNDLIPSSIRVDGIHLTTAGYKIISLRLDAWLKSISSPTVKKPINYSDLQSILSNPPSFNNININPATTDYPNSGFPSGYIFYNGLPFAFASTTLNNYFLAGAGYNYGLLYLSGTNANTSGTNNMGVGYSALTSLTSGSLNSAAGYLALSNNTTGSNNNAFGGNSLPQNSTGSNNNAFGQMSLYKNTSGSSNNAFGDSALLNNLTGTDNGAIGAGSLFKTNSGVANYAIGSNSLYYNTTGSYNIGIGLKSGYDTSASPWANTQSTVDNYMILIGEEASRDVNTLNSVSLTNGIAIGYRSKVGCSNCLALGGTGARAINVGIGTSSPWGILSIATTTVPTVPLFVIATSTSGTSTSTPFIVDRYGLVGIGTSTPAATLDIEGYMRLKKNTAQPVACGANNAGAIALSSSYLGCVCNGTDWINIGSSTQACVW